MKVALTDCKAIFYPRNISHQPSLLNHLIIASRPPTRGRH
jgi:hypothetical protein